MVGRRGDVSNGAPMLPTANFKIGRLPDDLIFRSVYDELDGDVHEDMTKLMD